MDLHALVRLSRSYRRFDETHWVDGKILRELIALAQYAPTGNNIQPLKFWLSNTPEMNAKIFPYLGWAASLKDWHGPMEGERPSAYIIILGDTEIQSVFGVDHGIAAQTLLLGAAEKGLGGCIIGSARRKGLQGELKIPDRYQVLLVLALGKPAEKVVTEPFIPGGDIHYYRDSDDVHHVPKRGLDELILHDV
jgi:nitroreductase